MEQEVKLEFDRIKNELQKLSSLLKNHRHSGSDMSQKLDKYAVIPIVDSNPTEATEGDLAIVSGKLKIYTSSTWTVVGTQT